MLKKINCKTNCLIENKKLTNKIIKLINKRKILKIIS